MTPYDWKPPEKKCAPDWHPKSAGNTRSNRQSGTAQSYAYDNENLGWQRVIGLRYQREISAKLSALLVLLSPLRTTNPNQNN
jgi:hypothetical protein